MTEFLELSPRSACWDIEIALISLAPPSTDCFTKDLEMEKFDLIGFSLSNFNFSKVLSIFNGNSSAYENDILENLFTLKPK